MSLREQSSLRPSVLKQNPATREEMRALRPQKNRYWGNTAISFVGDFVKGAAQAIARETFALSREVGAGIDYLLLPETRGKHPGVGKVEYTPQTRFERAIFGTDKPFSIQKEGADLIGIFGEDIQKEWGAASIPVGFALAGLNVLPTGWLKKGAVAKASKQIAKTKDVGTISKSLTPIFPTLKGPELEFVAKSLVDLNNEKTIANVIHSIGSIDRVATRSANLPLWDLKFFTKTQQNLLRKYDIKNVTELQAHINKLAPDNAYFKQKYQDILLDVEKAQRHQRHISGAKASEFALWELDGLTKAQKTFLRKNNLDTPADITKAIKGTESDKTVESLNAVLEAAKKAQREHNLNRRYTALEDYFGLDPDRIPSRHPIVKPEADMSLLHYDSFLDTVTFKTIDTAEDMLSQYKATARALKQAGVPAGESARTLRVMEENILQFAKDNGLKLNIKDGRKHVDDFVAYISRQPGDELVSTRFRKEAPSVVRDVGGGVFDALKTPIRWAQQADGMLDIAQKAMDPGRGFIESIIRFGQQSNIHRSTFLGEKQQFLQNMTKGVKELSKTDKDAYRVLSQISSADVRRTPEELLKLKAISDITTDRGAIKFAQDARAYLDNLLGQVNYFRKKRGQDMIQKRAMHTPDQIRETSYWSDIMGRFEGQSMLSGRSLPDNLTPNKAFNAHELQKKFAIPDYMKEDSLTRVLESYTNTIAKDIFNTNVIHNTKAHARALGKEKFPKLSGMLEKWVAESYGGLRGGVDRYLNLSETAHKGMAWWRNALIKSFFPLNLAWTTFLQTSSAVATVSKYGIKNSLGAASDWFTDPSARQWVKDNAYSYIMKTRGASMTKQDITTAMADSVRINKKPLDTAVDAANYFSDFVERQLTGWSVLAAKRDGMRHGMKGNALKWYASDGGAKTQSMYNIEDMPSLLRNEVVKTAVPFQTFSFEMFGNLLELAGRTGMPAHNKAEKIATIIRFMGAATAFNYISNSAINRKPWEASSFIPFYSMFVLPFEEITTGKESRYVWGNTRKFPAPIGVGLEFYEGIDSYFKTDSLAKLRGAAVKYLPGMFGIPAGIQANKMIDGIIAVSQEGHMGPSGNMMFPVSGPMDKVRAIFAGPWATSGAQEYWDRRDGNNKSGSEALIQRLSSEGKQPDGGGNLRDYAAMKKVGFDMDEAPFGGAPHEDEWREQHSVGFTPPINLPDGMYHDDVSFDTPDSDRAMSATRPSPETRATTRIPSSRETMNAIRAKAGLEPLAAGSGPRGLQTANELMQSIKKQADNTDLRKRGALVARLNRHLNPKNRPNSRLRWYQKVSKYARAFKTDPGNAWRALFTKEELGLVTGNLVELQRFYGLDYRDVGGSQQYKQKVMREMGIPWEHRDKYRLEHILPVRAGGGTDDANLVLTTKKLHDFYTPIDVKVGWAVQNKMITRKEAYELMVRFKVEGSLMPEDVLEQIELLAAQKSRRDIRYQEKWIEENKRKLDFWMKQYGDKHPTTGWQK